MYNIVEPQLSTGEIKSHTQVLPQSNGAVDLNWWPLTRAVLAYSAQQTR